MCSLRWRGNSEGFRHVLLWFDGDREPPSVVRMGGGGVLANHVTISSEPPVLKTTAGGGATVNYSFVFMPASLIVGSFAGSYEVLLVDGISIPTGMFIITVASNAINSFNGTL